MRTAFLSLVALITVVIASQAAFPMQATILEKRNEYGGRTEEELFFPEDDKYKEGLAKLVQYYDGNDRIIKLESFYTDGNALSDGVEQSIQHFDNRFYRTGIRTRIEFIYTESFADIEGLAKAIQYYDEAEKRIKIDYFYTDAYARKRQTSRLEVLYGSKGTIVKRTYLDKDGKVLSSENRQ